MGTRPTITVTPTNRVLLTNNSLAFTNVDEILGPSDGVAGTQAASNTINAESDVYRLFFSLPQEQSNAIIDAFEYTTKNVRSFNAAASDEVGWSLQVIDSAGTVRGQIENVHEFFSTVTDAGTSYYVAPLGPDNTSLFGAGSGPHIGTNANRFSTFGGIRITLQRLLGGSGASAQIDALELKIHYTPVDEGEHVVTVIPTAVAEVDAATLGVSLADGEHEQSWTNPSNALSVDTSRASCSGQTPKDVIAATAANPMVLTVTGHGLTTGDKIATDRTSVPYAVYSVTVLTADTFSIAHNNIGGDTGADGQIAIVEKDGLPYVGVSKFLRYTLPSGSIGYVPPGSPNEMRITWRGRVAAGKAYWCKIHDVVFLDASNNVLCRLSANGNIADKYGARTFKIGGYYTDATTGERDRVTVLDISSVPRSAFEAMSSAVAYVAIRFEMPTNADVPDDATYIHTVTMNGVSSVTFSFGENRTLTGSGASSTLRNRNI